MIYMNATYRYTETKRYLVPRFADRGAISLGVGPSDNCNYQRFITASQRVETYYSLYKCHRKVIKIVRDHYAKRVKKNLWFSEALILRRVVHVCFNFGTHRICCRAVLPETYTKLS